MNTQPNIVIVHCHDLGQFLNCYGVTTVSTPNIDAFARSGVLFEQSFCTAPQCSPSRSSIFTGRYPHSNGVMGLCHASFAWDLHEDEKHLAQFLKESGYATAAVGTLHETASGHERCGIDRHVRPAMAVQATDATVELLDELSADSNPFYIQIGFFEPHRLKQAPDADMGFVHKGCSPDDTNGIASLPYLQDTPSARAEIAELQGAVRHVDEQFGRILSKLDQLELTENTLVIFTTDHGIAMPRAKCSVYDPGLEVAFILRLPAREGWHGGVVRNPMISNVDYLPTLLDLLQIEIPDNIQGRSLTPLLDGGNYVTREEIFGELTYHGYYDPRRCIRTRTHKLIVNFSCAPFFMNPSQSYHPRSITVVPPNPAHGFHPLVELYDLESDPNELNNLCDDEACSAVREDLLHRLMKHLSETADPLLEGAVAAPLHHQAVSLLEGANGG